MTDRSVIKRRRRKEARPDEILQAAVEAFHDNGYERTIFWANPKLRSGMDDYLNWRVDNGVGVGSPSCATALGEVE